MKLSEKGTALRERYIKIRYTSFALLIMAAGSFVFFSNVYIMALLVAADIIMEVKLFRCPHCNKMLDCRRKTPEDASCPYCEKYIFKGL